MNIFRFRLKQDVDRFPDFLAKAGMTGTIVYYSKDDGILSAKMDEHLPGAEEWDNCITWADNATPGATALQDFLNDVEALL